MNMTLMSFFNPTYGSVVYGKQRAFGVGGVEEGGVGNSVRL